VRLPQGPWLPWSSEFRWDRWPWQGSTRHERRAAEDQRDLAVLIETALATIGPVVGAAGFAFRPDVARVSREAGSREVALLFEAAPEIVDRFAVLGDEGHGPCVDLWVYWYPDSDRLDLSLPGRLVGPAESAVSVVDRDAMFEALQAYATALAEQLGLSTSPT